jgi:hypothetical protein
MTARGPAILFAAAVLASIVWLIRGDAPPFGEYFEVARVSRNLAATGEFANPFGAAATGATAHVAPLLPALLAVLIRLLGSGAVFYIAMVGLMIAALALQAALLPAVSELLLGSRAPGLLAGAFAAVLPVFRFGAAEDCWFLGAWLLLFLLASRKAVDRFGADRGGALTGLLAGLLLLWSPVSLVIVAVWMFRLPLRASAVAALVAALVCAPWTVRNYRALGALMFVRDNLGIELRVSNNDHATPTTAGNRRSALRGFHPNESPAEAARVRELGEAAYNRACLAATRRWIAAHPAAFLRLTASRVRLFWFPEGRRAWPLWGLTAISIAGIALLGRRDRPAAWTLAAILALYPLIYYLVQAEERYRYPIVWVTLLLAGYAITAAVASRTPSARETS